MTAIFTFALDRPRLDGVRFVVERDRLPGAGEMEAACLDDLRDLARPRPGASFKTVIEAAAGDASVLAVIRNPRLVLDADLPARIAAARSKLPAADWTIAAAGGLGRLGRIHLALYASQAPSIPSQSGPWPIIDAYPDFYLLDAEAARRLASSTPEEAFELALIAKGYRSGRVSLFLPELVAGIDGPPLPLDHAVRCDAWPPPAGATQDTIPTLTGPIATDRADGDNEHLEAVDMVLAQHRSVPTLSIVVRTRFGRTHLLDRLLTSLQRARIDEVALDIVLATDVDAPDETFATVQARFRDLPLRLCRAARRGEPSRIANLRAGIEAAVGDYTCLVDDDDHLDLFAFQHFADCLYQDRIPIVAVGTELRRESWTETPSGRWVLESAHPDGAYPATGWGDMFTGVNRLPICGLICPTDWLQRRLFDFASKQELSEDYALFLHLLTAPDLPEIVEAAGTFCIVSLREGDQSVAMTDRRPWVRDIALHLAEGVRAAPGPGLWQLLAARHPAPERGDDLAATCARLHAELRLARSECDRLRAMILKEPA